jgi:hypothetical protein
VVAVVDPLTVRYRSRIVDFAMKNRLPSSLKSRTDGAPSMQEEFAREAGSHRFAAEAEKVSDALTRRKGA